MKQTVRNFFDYFLLGVLSVVPILVVVQTVLLIERRLRQAGLHRMNDGMGMAALRLE